MKIVSIEPTPSPHSMKVNVNVELPDGENLNYKLGDDLQNAPSYIKKLMDIEGVKNIYRVVDFIALARSPKYPWETILPEVRNALGSEEIDQTFDHPLKANESEDAFGEVKVFIQMFRSIPMQVKLEDGNTEQRFGLPELFSNAVMEASSASPHFIMERKWVEQHPRYGSTQEIGMDVVDELSASYDLERLDKLVKQAFEEDKTEDLQDRNKVSIETLDNPDWKVRYAALDRLNPIDDDLPLLDRALDDAKASIRRLATAYLGMIEDQKVLPYLYKALQDKAVNVRRTAGDCISDLGFKEAMPEMIESLSDTNRLVRWRAAMFLYEVGDDTAITALEKAADDPEFEVRMQINMALERIKEGHDAKGSVWHQMTQAIKSKE